MLLAPELGLKVLGKKELPEGYCQNVHTLNDKQYQHSLMKISQHIPEGKKLCSISLTSSRILEQCDYSNIPSIVRYDEETDDIFNPLQIWYYCKTGVDHLRPSVDIAIFNRGDDIAFVTYSKGAPVLCFEDEYGNIAFGTIFRKQLMQYGDYIFSSILEQMKGHVKLHVPVCTHFNYPNWASIPEYLEQTVQRYSDIKNVYIGSDTETNENLYGTKDIYNNAVVVF